MNPEEKIFFSIIIPSYHSENWINSTIESIRNQTYKNFEILVCDQAETNTQKVIANQDSIRFFYNEIASTFLARKKLIENAKGDYLVFLDSDDLLHPRTLEWLSETIENSNRLDCYKFGIQTFSKEPAFDNVNFDISRSQIYDCKSYILDSNKRDVQGASNIASTVLKNNQYSLPDYNVSMWEDVLIMNVLLNQCNQMLILDCPLYFYRIHNNSIMHSYSTKNLEDICKVLLELFNLYNYDKEIVARYLRQYTFYATYSLAKISNSKAGKKSIDAYFLSENVLRIHSILKKKEYSFKDLKAKICKKVLLGKRILLLKIIGKVKK